MEAEPLEPSVRATVREAEPVDCSAGKVEPEKEMVPGMGEARLPVMVTERVAAPRVALLVGEESVTVKERVP